MEILDRIVKKVQVRAEKEKSCLNDLIQEEVEAALKEESIMTYEEKLKKAEEFRMLTEEYESIEVKEGDKEFFQEIVKDYKEKNEMLNDEELIIAKNIFKSMDGLSIERCVKILKAALEVKYRYE